MRSPYTSPAMRFVLFVNPIAGSGKGAAAGLAIERMLISRGHAAHSVQASAGPVQDGLADRLAGADGLIVVGGDGTMRQAAPFAVEADVPVYQFPFGTENLFAREFGMSRDLETLQHAAETGARRRMDVGTVNGNKFLMMVSVGFDAEVTHDLARTRRGPISRLHYLPPIARQLLRWKAPRLHVTIDGRSAVDALGMVVVANTRRYAFRFDPALRANPEDGLLDVVFLPASTRLAVLRSALRCRMRRLIGKPGVFYGRGTAIRIEAAPESGYQVDGDPALESAEGGEAPGERPRPLRTPLDVGIRPSALAVMAPTMSGGRFK